MKRALSVLACLAMLLGTIGILGAVDVVIGTGSVMASTPLFYSYSGYSRYTALYTASEIGITGSITSLSFRVSTPITPITPVKIYLKTVSSTVLTADTWNSLTSGATLVYDGLVDFSSSGWKAFDIADYYYAGGNLMVFCEGNYGGSGCGEQIYFFYNSSPYTDTTGMALYRYQNSTPPPQVLYPSNKRANITLSIAASLAIPDVRIEELYPGVALDWYPISGATTYRVEWSLEPDAGFTTLGSTSSTVYTDISEGRKFYRVYAGTE